MKRTMGLVVPVTLVASCAAVGPDYVRPQMSMSALFVNGGSSALRDAAVERWWTGLNDPLLNSLVDRGLSQNLDIRTAWTRIRQAEAALARTGIASQLSGDISGRAGRERDSAGNIDDANSISADAAYVFDLFGGVRRSTESARASLEAAHYDRGTVRLAYLADIADAYVNARYFQNAAWITRQAIQSRRAAFDLVSRQAAAGEATMLDEAQARALLRSAEAALPSLQANFEGNVFRIATLLAEPAGPIMQRMTQGSGQPVPQRLSKSGTPADLLRNRPDIRAAEREFAASTAAIGVAEAQLYPSLTLSGFISSGDDETWAFGPVLRVPVLNQGVLRANRDAAKARAAEADLNWRSTVLRAVEEVQEADSSTRYWRRQVGAQRSAAQANNEVRDLTKKSYEAAETVLTDVLDAERRSLDSQIALAGGLRDLATSWIRLQVATGRGWSDQPPPDDAMVAVAE
ncbi:Multidrug/solvent efflux pump outer membrane protein MepC [Defluviimonas aquaemixtae]|uniref:Multidrug/solvent efflux pump outer membrane protein MepC n=1 Tax=Albidovulum aquaemixtae TaxID=1542388 RepID=A0A2R8BLI0_9RHOB|nr:efflux transporter outer membrane subunit [Defluviimonas aquaemixtae]SPH24247.1 Multidrug/solvent efflux pump outer membrane protein MepC [Defluviimonas aquaemixtae]